MGLKYVSSDSSNLMTALEQNITQIKSEMDTLSTGANQLVLAVDGRTLSGAAYTAASGLFSECIIPAIQKTKSAVDAIQTDLSSYKTQDGTVSGEGVLDEDELNKQLTSLKSQKKSAEQMSSYLSTQVTNLSRQKGTDYSSYIGQLNSSITSLSSTISSLGSDIAEVERKLKLLQNFSANTSGLFAGAKDGLSVSMQAVMMLSQVTINSDGSYSFPAGDASWFTTKQKDVNNSLVYALYTMPEEKDGKDKVEKNNAEKSNENNFLSNLIDILFGSTYTSDFESTYNRNTTFWKSQYVKYSTAIETDEDGIFKGKFQNGYPSGLAIDLSILSIEAEFSDWHLNVQPEISLFGYQMNLKADIGFDTKNEFPTPEVDFSLGYGKSDEWNQDWGLKVSTDLWNGLVGGYGRYTTVANVSSHSQHISSVETGFQTINGIHATVIVGLIFAPELTLPAIGPTLAN